MSHDQQTSGTDTDLPCPWCGEKQDLSELEISTDSQVSCDGCGRLYAVTKMEAEASCPKCAAAVRVNEMQLTEDAVVHCGACHQVFRPSDTKVVFDITAERVAGGS